MKSGRAYSVAIVLGLSAPAIAQDLSLVGAKIYPSPKAPPIPDGVVLIRERRIVAAGERSSVLPGAENGNTSCGNVTRISSHQRQVMVKRRRGE